MAMIRIVAIVVGDTSTVFYKEDGSTITLESTDPRIPNLVANATPLIAVGLVADLDFSSVDTKHYRDFEQKTNGFVKLFRVAKNLVKHIFAEPKQPEPQVIGEIPKVNPTPIIKDSTGITIGGTPIEGPFVLDRPAIDMSKANKLASAAQEIISKATPVSDKSFTDDETKDNDTIIAVVESKEGKQTIIPGMENLKDHMAAALKLGSTTGVENFLRRISTVIDERGHSIDDLLRFMAKNDMPIADDGCLVAFKTLNRRGSHLNEYVDIHSGKVVQRVGSKVFMAPSLVDPDRRQDCSNGLHVARRAYVGGFRGDSGVMVLIKVAPEDAIAVPQYDGNKMRVCGYHIVADVPKQDHQTVFGNKPIGKDTETAKVLTAVLAGKHIGIIEEVEIGGHKGTNLRITKFGSEAHTKSEHRKAQEEIEKAEPIMASIDDDRHGVNVSHIDTKKLASDIAAVKASTQNSKNTQARILFEAGKFEELKAFKKAAKKSFASLGLTPEEVEQIEDGSLPLSAPEVPVEEPKKEEPIMVEEPKGPMTKAEEARQLFFEAIGGDKSRWGTLWTLKKKLKKSWESLGFTPKEIERINTNKPDWV